MSSSQVRKAVRRIYSVRYLQAQRFNFLLEAWIFLWRNDLQESWTWEKNLLSETSWNWKLVPVVSPQKAQAQEGVVA